MNLSDRFVSLIRTVVPVAVGTFAAWLAAKTGIVLGETDIALVTGLAISGYYTLVRWAESKWPALGWLLGVAKTPEYPKPQS